MDGYGIGALFCLITSFLEFRGHNTSWKYVPTHATLCKFYQCLWWHNLWIQFDAWVATSMPLCNAGKLSWVFPFSQQFYLSSLIFFWLLSPFSGKCPMAFCLAGETHLFSVTLHFFCSVIYSPFGQCSFGRSGMKSNGGHPLFSCLGVLLKEKKVPFHSLALLSSQIGRNKDSLY